MIFVLLVQGRGLLDRFVDEPDLVMAVTPAASIVTLPGPGPAARATVLSRIVTFSTVQLPPRVRTRPSGVS
jgi:hypothetical protein